MAQEGLGRCGSDFPRGDSAAICWKFRPERSFPPWLRLIQKKATSITFSLYRSLDWRLWSADLF
jgi:hypothetical protein